MKQKFVFKDVQKTDIVFQYNLLLYEQNVKIYTIMIILMQVYLLIIFMYNKKLHYNL